MGCFISSHAKDYKTRSRDNRFETRTTMLETGGNIVRKPTPWGYGGGPLSQCELQEMRNEFWHHVVQVGGRPEIWGALRAATESHLHEAQRIIDDNSIRLGNSDMSVCYDEDGTRYNLPLFVLSEPTNMEYRVLRVR